VSTLRALELKQDEAGQLQLQGNLRFLPGPVQDIILFCREHSARALFAGLRPAVAATAVSQGIYHSIYSVLRQLAVAHKLAAMQRHQQQQQHAPWSASAPSPPLLQQLPDGGKSVGISVGASMLVASLAGAVNVLVTNPLWVTITQIQALHRNQGGAAGGSGAGMSTLAVARQVYRDHGLAGFFKGLMPSMVRAGVVALVVVCARES
jgi:adenine nucleotide transporter 17